MLLFFSSVMATGGKEDRTARTWSTKTDRCRCLGVFTGHENEIIDIALYRDFLITGGMDTTIIKWNMTTCDCVHVFKGHRSRVNELICTKNYIFSSSCDHTVRCWDFDNGETIRVFEGHTRSVAPLIVLSDGDAREDNGDRDGTRELVIAGSSDSTVRSWSFETGETLHILQGHSSAVTCMAMDSHKRTLFTGSNDCIIIFWDILQGHALRKLTGHSKGVSCLTVS